MRGLIVIVIFLLVVIIFASISWGVVMYIYDGDTLRVWTLRGPVVIRIAGIDAPERGELGFDASTLLLQRLLPIGTFIIFDPTREDKWGRQISHVYLGVMSIGDEMTRIGGAISR